GPAIVSPPRSNRWREFLCRTHRSVPLTKAACRSSIRGSKNQTIRVGFRPMRCLSVRGTTILASTVYMKHCFWSVMAGRTCYGLPPHTPTRPQRKIGGEGGAVTRRGKNKKFPGAGGPPRGGTKNRGGLRFRDPPARAGFPYGFPRPPYLPGL